MEIKYASVTFSRELKSNIVFCSEFNCGYEMDLSMAKKIVASRLEFTENHKHYIIADLSGIKRVTREASEYMLSPAGGAENILGGAFLANNPVTVLLANVFMKKVKNIPTKFFSDKKKALLWIEEIKQNAFANKVY
jgi:hypothetical protein